MIHMNAKIIGIGTFLLVVLIWALVVVGPRFTNPETSVRSEIHRKRTPLEERGRDIYMRDGCQYCHSQYIRTADWGLGAERIAQAGDYVGEKAPQLGSIRNGPDLSQEGGEHTDDWHAAHFYNPRWTRPESFMPPFSHYSDEDLKRIIAYVQSLGGTMADARVRRQWKWREQTIEAYEAGVDSNIEWLHSHVPKGWLEVPTPYPITEVSRLRGQTIYQRHCLGCHGPVGDGQGPAVALVYPPPLNFTTLRRHGLEGGATGGMLYYQIMNGITGTAMPYFKRELESEKIWDVSNYVAEQFIGLVDANTEPRGIDAAFEPPDPSDGKAGE
ncbi:MAG: cbb3-type cytochrome c oxidase subunit II [Deltaproteobacteria bacterium]|nr:cbb3-type cytochrome c oxidase subunit II [Deltaproteobacteria bacterium]